MATEKVKKPSQKAIDFVAHVDNFDVPTNGELRAAYNEGFLALSESGVVLRRCIYKPDPAKAFVAEMREAS